MVIWCQSLFIYIYIYIARDKIHLKVLEAIYIAINPPSLCRQLSTHILNILGELLETGVTCFFSYLVSLILLINLNPVFKNFQMTSLTSAGRKGPCCFIILEQFLLFIPMILLFLSLSLSLSLSLYIYIYIYMCVCVCVCRYFLSAFLFVILLILQYTAGIGW